MSTAAAAPLRLARDSFDVSLFTNQAGPHQAFWQGEVGTVFEERLQIREGQAQYRHALAGSFIKVSHVEAPLPAVPPSGLRELLVARPGQGAARTLSDPDGNRVSLVAPGTLGVGQLAMWLHVRDLEASRRFYGAVLGLPVLEAGSGPVVRIGQSLLLLRRDPGLVPDSPVHGPGWRFLSLQVFDVRGLYAGIIAAGGREGIAPKRLGDVARYAFVRDPDGTWIELSQRASLTGPLGED
jgi:lactoylglutathione lyase